MSLPRLIPAVPTPFDADFRINCDSLAALCRRHFDEGAGAVVLFGTTGEGTFFSAGEKFSTLASLIGNGIPPWRIILATGACPLDDAARLVRAALDQGCLASLVLPPFFAKAVDDEGLADWFDALIARTSRDAAILLYHIPVIAGVGFSAELVARLHARFPTVIRGVKDSTPDSALARQLAGRDIPGIFVSTEVNLGAKLDAGLAGTISASLNITLPLVRTALAQESGDLETRIAAIRGLLAEKNLIWAVKTALAAQTGDPVWQRIAPPHRPPASPTQAEMLARLQPLIGRLEP